MDLTYLSSIIYSLIPLGFGMFLLNIIRVMMSSREERTPALQALNNLFTDKIWFLVSAFTVGCYLLVVPSTFIGLFTSLNMNYYFYVYAIMCGILGIINLILEKDRLRLTLKKLKRKNVSLKTYSLTSSLIMFITLIIMSFRFLQLLLLHLTSPLIWQWDVVSIYLPIARSIFLTGSLKENVIFYSGGIAINGYPPLVPIFYAFVMRFYYYAFRFVPIVIHVIMLLVIYKLALKLLNNKLAGILAVIAFIFSPILDFIWARDLLYLDTAFIAFLLISTFYAISFLEDRNGFQEFVNLVFYCISSGLLLMSKDLAIFFIMPGLGLYLWKKLSCKSSKAGILALSLLSIFTPLLLTAYDSKFLDNRAYLLIPLSICVILTALGMQKNKPIKEQNSTSKLLADVLIASVIFITPLIVYLLYNVFIRHLNLYPSVTHFGLAEWVVFLGLLVPLLEA